MGKFIDLTGKKFGRLTVIEVNKEKTDEMRKLKKYRTYWICLCECGNYKTINQDRLTRGVTKSCGCLAKEAKLNSVEKRRHNAVGEKFERLLVLELDIEKTSEKQEAYYKCQCDCGNIKLVSYSNLINGHSKSCGCLRKEVSKNKNFKDLTGKKFGRWTVLNYDEEKSTHGKNGKSMWFCECECGTKKSVDSSSLIVGDSTSCGCYAKERIREILFKDLTGQKFGRLIVLRYDEKNSTHGKNGISKWICRCECGNEKSVSYTHLVCGDSTSCGCYNKEIVSGENSHFWKGGATELKTYLRFKLTEWRKESLKHANYKCCITGKNGKFNIHHIYPFQYIFDETMDELDMPIYEKIGEYTEEELDKILKLLLEKHFYYGYGAVVLEDIHKKFHNIYGTGAWDIPPGEKEWEEFKNTYKITNN